MELSGRFWIGRKRPPVLHAAESGSILLSNYSRGGRRYMNGSFADMVSHARQAIYLTTPYFVPNQRTQRLLCEAAQRGVDVRLLVPRKHDIRLAQWAAHAAYEVLLESGVRIFEYLPRLLHSKTTVVDGDYATIGTSNIDYRSFFLNYELNLFTHDSWLCERLRAVFLEDLQQSEEILVEQWRTRFWGRKALELVGWLARRLL
jgi:cardiolipin synthase